MLEDRKTLDAFRRGDRAVLANVYYQYLPLVAALARQGFGFYAEGAQHRFHGFSSNFEHNDVIQECFARAFSERARLGFNGLDPYAAYLTGIVKNVVADIFRSRRAQLLPFDSLPACDQASQRASEPPLDDALDQTRLRASIQDFVKQLPLIEQDFVRLRYMQNLPQHRVCTRMKIRRSRVRTLERRVRDRLEQWLLQHGFAARSSTPHTSLGLLLAVLS